MLQRHICADALCDQHGHDPEPRAYLADHDAALQEIGALAYWLVVVIELADDADGMTAGPLREELRRVAEHVRGRESVRRAEQVTHG